MSNQASCLTFLFISILFSCVISNSDKANKAKIVYKDNLESLIKIVYNPEKDSSLQVVNLISFFERLTNVPSESDGNYIGKYTPTRNDIERWTKWYEKNRDELQWNTVKQEFEVIY